LSGIESGDEEFSSEFGRCLNVLENWVEVLEVKPAPRGILVRGILRTYEVLRSKDLAYEVYKKVENSGCSFMLRLQKGVANIYLTKKSGSSHVFLALALGAIMVVTLYLTGLALNSPPKSFQTRVSWSPWDYVLGLLIPLLLHETGHYVTMRKYNVPSSVPIPLPGPPAQLGFLGTFGSVILMRWMPPTSEALALIGVAGPLTGFIAALPLAVLGLKESLVVPLSQVGPETVSIGFSPLIFSILVYAERIPVAGGKIIILSPLAFAAFVMFLVTFLNLLPIGQLDGGHVIRAALGERGHRYASTLTLLLLLALSIVLPSLGFFAILAFFLYFLGGFRHPGPAIPHEKLGKLGQIAVIIYALLLVLTMPVPS
jgi:Zn-dependent protease